MSRKHGLVIGALALLGSGVGAGILIQQQYQVARTEAGVEFARDLAGLNASLPRAPGWEEWVYPGADLKRSGSGGGMQINDEVIVPIDYRGVWTTPAAFEDVIRHYGRFMQFEDPESLAKRDPTFAGSSAGTFSSDSGPATNSHLRDNGSSNSFDPRPVRVECLTRRCRSYTVTVFISRAENEDLTHVIVLYSPLTEMAAAGESQKS